MLLFLLLLPLGVLLLFLLLLLLGVLLLFLLLLPLGVLLLLLLLPLGVLLLFLLLLLLGVLLLFLLLLPLGVLLLLLLLLPLGILLFLLLLLLGVLLLFLLLLPLDVLLFLLLLPLGVLLLLLLLLLSVLLLLLLLLLPLGVLLFLLLLLLGVLLLLLLLLLTLDVLLFLLILPLDVLLLLLLLPLSVLLLLLLLLALGVLLFLLILPLDVLLLFLLLLPLDVLLFLLLLPLGILLFLLLLLLGVLLLFLLLLPLDVLLFLLLLPLGILLFLLLLLLGVLLLFLLLLPLGVLLFLLLLLLGVLLLFLLLLLLDVLLLFLLLLPLDVLLLLLFLLLLRRALHSAANRRLNTPYPAHIHDANRRARSRRTLAYLLDLGWRKRAAGVFSQRRLLPLERNRSRRRSGSRHHGPAQHVGRRTRGAGGGVRPGAENALPLGRNGRSGDHLDRSQLSSRYRARVLIYPAPASESVLRNRRDAVLDPLVHVGNRRIIGIPAVVIVVNGGVVDHRVGVVHPRKVTLAHLVRRKIRFTRTQGEPAYCRSSADGKTQAETGAASSSADPPHQCRSIEGSHAIRSGYPAPAAAKGSPAAIVIRSESPRRVVHPGPTPGGDPGPMPVMIGRPVCGDRGGHPYLSVARLIPPAAVLVEVVVAGDFARNVTCGLGLVFAAITRGAPLVEFVGSAGGREVVVNLIVASHHHPLARVNRERLTAAGHFALSIAHRDDGRLRIRIRVDAVFAGTI